jgi:hypothetical protein
MTPFFADARARSALLRLSRYLLKGPLLFDIFIQDICNLGARGVLPVMASKGNDTPSPVVIKPSVISVTPEKPCSCIFQLMIWHH